MRGGEWPEAKMRNMPKRRHIDCEAAEEQTANSLQLKIEGSLLFADETQM
jgi:hypothetical protein